MGFLPLGPVDLFARVGAIDWNADIDAPNLDVRASDDGTDLTYGVGAQFRVWSLSLRAEYERFDISDADTVDMISLGRHLDIPVSVASRRKYARHVNI